MKWIKRILSVFVVVGIVGGLAWAGVTYLPKQSEGVDDSSLTQLMLVERGNLTASVSPTGEVYAPHQAQLSFDVTRIPLVELNVVAGQEVEEGELLARIDRAPLERALRQAQANLLSAEDALAKAKDPYSDLDRRHAELVVDQAETALEAAQQSLVDLENPDLDAAQEIVEEAAQQLEEAQEDLAALEADASVQEQLDRLQWQVNEAEVAHGEIVAKNESGELYEDRLRLALNRWLDAQDALESAKIQAALVEFSAKRRVAEAEESLADAKAALSDLQAGPTALELAQARNQVAQAEYNLTKAEDDLAEIMSGPDERDIQVAQTSYNAALAVLEEAQAALDGVTMVAPFDATVVSVGGEVGDLVSSGVVIVALADLTELRIRATVDETDISQVEVGQPVLITFDAFPGKQFQGEVLEVPLEGRLAQNIVTYEVPISLEGTEGVALKSGMTANLNIVVGQRENVLLVPVLAVQQGDSGDVVQVQDSPEAEPALVPVEVGLSDGTYVEVVRGLNEGDRVVVQYEATEEQTMFGFGRMEGGVIIEGQGMPPGGPSFSVGPGQP